MTEDEFLTRFHHAKQVKTEADYPLKHAGKPAGVLIPLVKHDNGLNVLLTRRALHLRHHPGQISFPGGRQEPSDQSAADAALRETFEEIGIQRKHIEIVGQLPTYRTISGYAMEPFIGLLPPNLSLTLDENEVCEAFEVPLSHVLNKNNYLIHWVERRGRSMPIYFIPYQDIYIWGATAAILRNLSNHFDPE
ncbi:CoA pyrophosphatase [Alteromonas facilis]|uniref:CoA pyrophosphatase n=1 Tax=Alteromonas facilis TaxID=2048004 RepID=UPI000C2895CB|nr:CoA pyrophosphatase [Alteromonas facilis]